MTALHAYGVEQGLNRDEPAFPAISDEAMEHAARTYGDAYPDAFSDALATAACRLAQLAADARGCRRVESRAYRRRHTQRRAWLLEHALHDSQHHLDDAERWLRLLTH